MTFKFDLTGRFITFHSLSLLGISYKKYIKMKKYEKLSNNTKNYSHLSGRNNNVPEPNKSQIPLCKAQCREGEGKGRTVNEESWVKDYIRRKHPTVHYFI